MSKIKVVQFLGFEAREDDKYPEQKFAMDRAQWSAQPKWLQDVLDQGRIHIDGVGRHGEPGRPGDTRLIYHPPAPYSGQRLTIESNAWLVDRGDGVLRVVDNATYEAVQHALA